jgi:uncharacterized membrane protein (DUF4010 family)
VIPDVTTNVLLRLAVAGLGGAAVGIEREWSGHAAGPSARFAGVRTFTLMGGLAGLAGWLWTAGAGALAVVLLSGLLALVVAAYVRASAHDVGATTEVAAVVTAAAGVVAGLGLLGLASGIIAVTCLVLLEKSHLHAWVASIDEPGLKAGVRFAVMAAVVLPLLPAGPFGPWGGVRPRQLWALVLFFSGLSYMGYVARHLAGPRQGYPLAGLLGGLVSSTNVTLTFARLSSRAGAPIRALATGALAASVVLLPRVWIACTVLNPSLALRLVPVLIPALVAGVALVFVGYRRASDETADAGGSKNPLEFWSALQMAVLFQGVLFITNLVSRYFGDAGLIATGAVLGLTDLDALTLSMAQQVTNGLSATTAAGALTAGILSNTAVKAALALTLGRGGFRTMVPTGLGAMGAALLGAALFFLR